MKIIAHRGGTGKGLQNSPAGVRLAAQHQADFVELDILSHPNGGFHCAHGWDHRYPLADCLSAVQPPMGLIAHLKGYFSDADLTRLANQITHHLPLEKVIFASHTSSALHRLRALVPSAKLARFGWFPSVTALWKKHPWDHCLINHLVLHRCHVSSLQRRGYVVFASCVWEFRSLNSVRQTGVDGSFVNLQ